MKLVTKFSVWSLVVMIAAVLSASCSSGRSKTNDDNASTMTGAQYLAKYRDVCQVKHLVLVICDEGSKATVQIYAKDRDGNTWSLVEETDGHIGRSGCKADKHEGDGATPLGDFGITTAFGIKSAPHTALKYIKVTPSMYAVDTDCEYYNKIIETAHGGPKEGEHMYEYTPDYNYGLALDYNKECVAGKGSNIFLHCKGVKPSTLGCVAIDERLVRYLIETLTPDDRICIVKS